MKWFVKCLRDDYVNFRGRASRREFWSFFAIMMLIWIPVVVFSELLHLRWLYVFVLALALPYFAVVTRRLHDTGRSGWWGAGYLALVVANRAWDYFWGSETGSDIWFTGEIVFAVVMFCFVALLLYWLASEADPEANKYGSIPDSRADRPSEL